MLEILGDVQGGISPLTSGSEPGRGSTAFLVEAVAFGKPQPSEILEPPLQLRALNPGWLTGRFPLEPGSLREPSATVPAAGTAAGSEHTLAAGSQGSTPFQALSHFPRRDIWISPLSYSKHSCKYDQKYLNLLAAAAV